jgi:hypothetical protein
MEHIPWAIGGSEFLQDIFVAVEYARIKGIRGGDMGGYHSAIVFKWQKCSGNIATVVRWLT